MKYKLDILNDKDFEDLAKDLLEAETGKRFQNFRSGKDKGIDLRYAENVENEIIVQAKHYLKSTFADLKHKLRLEKGKMDRLSYPPRNYILFTSFDLNVAQVDEVVKILQPYASTSQNVYGLSRIEQMLSEHRSVEKKHYKLWLTSASVLQTILHNGIKGRSEFVEKRILQRIKLYVPTQNFDEAVEKLKEHHFLMVTGEPGVGKTTIANLLICEFLAKNYELIYIDEKIADAEDLISSDPNTKQIVFFDDFLGSNIHDVTHPKNSQSKIVSFVERIKSTPNKYLIMTTRTTILNQATQAYDKLNSLTPTDDTRYSVLLKKYSNLDKAKILYNHLYHIMEESNREVFFKDKFYLRVIKHQNYFPRLIEFITSEIQSKKRGELDSRDFILRSLDNPSEIWAHAFFEQLNHVDQFLLCTLFSMGGYRIDYSCLHEAFDSRYSYEIKYNNHPRLTDAFNISLKKLTDGFVRISKDQYNKIEVNLLNPSIADFLLSFYRSGSDEVKRLFYPVRYLEQILTFFGNSNEKINIPKEQIYNYYLRFNELMPELDFFTHIYSSREIAILYIYLEFFKDFVKEAQLIELVKKIDLGDFFADEFQYWLVLEYLVDYGEVVKYINEHWKGYFKLAIDTASEESSFRNIIHLLRCYNISVEMWSKDEDFFLHLIQGVNRLYSHNLTDVDFEFLRDDIWETFHAQSSEQAICIIDGVIANKYDIFIKGCGLDEFSDVVWDEFSYDPNKILNEYIERWEADSYDFEPSININESSVINGDQNEEDAIELLFER